VQAPSQKVYFYDTFGRHFGKFGFQQWQGFQSSRQPLGAFDSSVVVRVNSEVNQGAIRISPQLRRPNITYLPAAIEPLAPSGTAPGKPYFTFTKGGLNGIDFKGGEIRSNAY